MAEGSSSVGLDEMLDALGHIQMRQLLVALLKHQSLDDSSVVITGSDTEVWKMKRLVAMRHNHIPKLEEYGFIRWDQESHKIIMGENFDDIQPLLELLQQHADELPADWV